MKSSYDALLETFSNPGDGLNARTQLNNGVPMPWFGLGVYQMGDDATTQARVQSAIRCGYRSIDTASIYGNEAGVGAAIRESGVPRDELFITTKVWNEDLRAERVEAAFEESMARLGLDYLDLYLIHWPVAEKFIAAWKVMERLQRSGRIRAIGVSNFMVPHLEELLAETEVIPAVNQIEFHPYLRSTPLLEYCRSKDIRLTAWSPLMQGTVLQDETIRGIAARLGKSPAQIVLRWEVQSGVVTIPKSSHEERIATNADIFDFSLSPADMAAIDSLDRQERCGPDPYTFDF